MWKVTIRNLLAHKMRVVATSVAILLGVAFVSGSFVLTNTIDNSFDDLFSTVYQHTDVVVRPTAGLQSQQQDEQRASLSVPAAALTATQKVDGVGYAEGSMSGNAQVIDRNGKPMGGGGPPTMGGNWSDSADLNPFHITKGAAPKAANEIVLDAGTAKRGKFDLGDAVNVVTEQGPESYKLSGIAKFGSVDSPLGATYVLFTSPKAQQVFGLNGDFSEIDVVAKPGISQETLQERISKVVPTGAEAVTGKTVQDENKSGISTAIGFFNKLLLFFAGVALFVGAFIINNTFTILAAQRTRELALLRAIGARRKQVSRSFLGEAFCVGLFASLIGWVGGILLALGARAALGAFGVDVASGSLIVGWNSLIASLATGVVITMVAAMLPARRAGRVPPVAAMRSVAIENTKVSKWRVVLGILGLVIGGALMASGVLSTSDQAYVPVGVGVVLAFVAIAVLVPTFTRPVVKVIGLPFLLQGTTGRLAIQNAMRNPRRSASTASALMIGVAVVTFFTVIATSAKVSISDTIDKSFTGDFVVNPDGQAGLPQQLSSQIGSLSEVRAESPVRVAPTEIDGLATQLTGFDMSKIDQIYNLSLSGGTTKDVASGGLAVSKDAAKSRRLSVGQIVDLKFEKGVVEKRKIVATFDSQSNGSDYIVDLSVVTPHQLKPVDNGIVIKQASGSSPEAARAAIAKVTSAYPNAKIQDLSDIKKSVTSTVDAVLNFIYVLLALAILIALLGIANTLALSIFERTHEIGLLRAVGTTKGQMRAMIRSEAVMIAVFGALLGMAVGVGFSIVLLDSLNEKVLSTVSLPWGRLVVIMLIAAVAGVLAALWPARRAARQNILDAIATS